MKPFLLLQARPEIDAANDEYAAFLKFSNLKPEQLLRLHIESGDLPHINLDDYSGIILAGGPYSVSDPPTKKSPAQKKCEAWLFNLMDQIVDKDFPFLGTCYGVGILGSHQKGKISKRYSEVIGAVTVTLTPAAKADKLTKGLSSQFQAFVGHKESCEVLPKSATLLASSELCPVQMFRVKNNVYATQFHPELDPDGLAVRIRTYKHHGYFPPHAAEELIIEGYEQEVTEPEKILKLFVETYQS